MITAFGPRARLLRLADSRTPYDPAVPRALVFGYHGSNYTGQDDAAVSRHGEGAARRQGGLRLPGRAAARRQPSKAWDLTAPGMDMPFFDAMLAKMSADYCVDPKRIFVAGQSYGGLMTEAVGCLRGDVVRANRRVAGSGPNKHVAVQGPGRRVDHARHGRHERRVHQRQKSRDFWVMKNGCTTTTTQGTPMQCQNYQGCMPGLTR
jgi:poly(3-hydroxybutyrate) depolymerase